MVSPECIPRCTLVEALDHHVWRRLMCARCPGLRYFVDTPECEEVGDQLRKDADQSLGLSCPYVGIIPNSWSLTIILELISLCYSR